MKKLLSFILTGMLTVSALSCFGTSAETFKATTTNFRPVFDFDSTPAAYTNGYAPGTRTDTVGDSKSEKCITAEGIGLTYNLTIDNKDSYSGNALKLDVTDLSPEGGSYCPISFNVKYGAKKLVNVSGATDFVFWADTTKFKDNIYSNQKGIILYIQETNVAADGSLTDAATAWKPKAGTAGGYYEYEKNGSWVKVKNGETDFLLPANYRGWIKLPLSTFTYCDWTGAERNATFKGKQIQVVQFGMGNYKRQAGSTIVFDEIGFMGSFSKAAETTSAKTTKSNANNTTSKVNTNANTTETQTDTSSQTLTTESDTSSALTTVSSNTDTTSAAKSDKTGNATAWIWIAAAVVVLAAGGAGFYFFYVKRKKS